MHNDLKLFSVSGANELVVRIILASYHFNIQNNPKLGCILERITATVKYVFVFVFFRLSPLFLPISSIFSENFQLLSQLVSHLLPHLICFRCLFASFFLA